MDAEAIRRGFGANRPENVALTLNTIALLAAADREQAAFGLMPQVDRTAIFGAVLPDYRLGIEHGEAGLPQQTLATNLARNEKHRMTSTAECSGEMTSDQTMSKFRRLRRSLFGQS